ncbi:MAG: tRNA pseudouridine(55) synthase TruB [Candidatus Baltobacteraceae bacterium]
MLPSSSMMGFVNVCKPAGPTSTQIVTRVRRIFSTYSEQRDLAAGHLGTLDPQAAGVLPVAIGKATRLIPLLEDRRKCYALTLVLGRSTTTQDALGESVECAPVPENILQRVEEVLPAFCGRIEQIPPMFSALHYGGKRLYDLARAGVTVERKARTISIYDLSILGFEAPDTVRMRVACSEGTYVRTLCADLGAAVGVPAHMGALVREASGPFLLAEALTLEEIAEAPETALLAPDRIVPFPTVVLDLRASADFRAGRTVAMAESVGGKHVFVRDAARTLVGVGEAHGVMLAPRKVFV